MKYNFSFLYLRYLKVVRRLQALSLGLHHEVHGEGEDDGEDDGGQSKSRARVAGVEPEGEEGVDDRDVPLH